MAEAAPWRGRWTRILMRRATRARPWAASTCTGLTCRASRRWPRKTPLSSSVTICGGQRPLTRGVRSLRSAQEIGGGGVRFGKLALGRFLDPGVHGKVGRRGGHGAEATGVDIGIHNLRRGLSGQSIQKLYQLRQPRHARPDEGGRPGEVNPHNPSAHAVPVEDDLRAFPFE